MMDMCGDLLLQGLPSQLNQGEHERAQGERAKAGAQRKLGRAQRAPLQRISRLRRRKVPAYTCLLGRLWAESSALQGTPLSSQAFMKYPSSRTQPVRHKCQTPVKCPSRRPALDRPLRVMMKSHRKPQLSLKRVGTNLLLEPQYLPVACEVSMDSAAIAGSPPQHRKLEL